jgi:hypothetical protein
MRAFSSGVIADSRAGIVGKSPLRAIQKLNK